MIVTVAVFFNAVLLEVPGARDQTQVPVVNVCVDATHMAPHEIESGGIPEEWEFAEPLLLETRSTSSRSTLTLE